MKLEKAKEIVLALFPNAKDWESHHTGLKYPYWQILLLSEGGNSSRIESYICLNRTPNSRFKKRETAWIDAAKKYKQKYKNWLLSQEKPNAKCWIWSGEHRAYWRENAGGYTIDRNNAGLYTLKDAWDKTCHCGPEKQIVLQLCDSHIEQMKKLKHQGYYRLQTTVTIIEVYRIFDTLLCFQDRVLKHYCPFGDFDKTNELLKSEELFQDRLDSLVRNLRP